MKHNQISHNTQIELEKARREQQKQTRLIFNDFKDLDRQSRIDSDITLPPKISPSENEQGRKLRLIPK